jgi:hypothetical protein
MTVTPNILTILGTGQVIIPPGSRAFSVSVVSGTATIGAGTVLFPGTIWPTYTAADAKLVLGTSIAVGATGVGGRTNVFYAL